MGNLPDFDELLDEDENTQAFDADTEPDFTPNPDKNAGVVAVEPPIIAIGRKNRKDELHKLPPEQS